MSPAAIKIYLAVIESLLTATPTIRYYTHAELNILHKVLDLSLPSKIVEVGVLGSCCFLCTEYMKLITTKYDVDIHISGTHATVCLGWAFPKDCGANPDVSRGLMEVVEKKLDIYLDKVHQMIRHDFVPIGSEEQEQRPIELGRAPRGGLE